MQAEEHDPTCPGGDFGLPSQKQRHGRQKRQDEKSPHEKGSVAQEKDAPRAVGTPKELFQGQNPFARVMTSEAQGANPQVEHQSQSERYPQQSQ